MPVTDGQILGQLIKSDEPLLVEELAGETPFTAPALLERGVRSTIAVLIRGESKDYGAFGVHSTEPAKFVLQDVVFVRGVANVIAAGLDRDAHRAGDDRFWELSPDLLATVTLDGYLTWVSPAWEHTLGHTMAELTSRPYLDFVHPDDAEQTASVAAAFLDQGDVTLHYENRYRAKDESYRWLAWSARRTPESDAIYAIARDVTKSKATEEALRSSGRRLKMAQRIAHVGSWDYSFTDSALTLSGEARAVCGVVGEGPTDYEGALAFVHVEDRPAVRMFITETVRAGRAAEVECRVVGTDGSERAIRLFGEPIRENDHVVGIQGAVKDVTPLRTSERALHDSRELFDHGFDRATAGMGVIDAGLKALVRVNDALCEITGRDREELGTPGSLVRMTPPDDRARDHVIYERLIAGEMESDEREKRFLRVDGSVGWVARTLSPIRDPAGAITGFFVRVTDITERREREESQRGDARQRGVIRAGLDQGRFVLHAQPIIELASGRVVRHELLIRLLGEDGKLIPPGTFLPAAEKYGLIQEIDIWVITEASRIIAETGNPIALNLSGSSIGRPEALRVIELALQTPGVKPSDFVFEITETALMQNLENAKVFAEKLTAMGCELALDDFGTGFGGFTYLKRLGVDYLKIDMDFVRELPRNPHDQRVVEAIVGLARGFGLKTVAEGVEDAETLLLLAELGVSHGQGYHIGRPSSLTIDGPTGPGRSTR